MTDADGHHADPVAGIDWQIFCRVIDNFGDLGVCWRLARLLAGSHGLTVHLQVDDWNTVRRLLPGMPVEARPCRLDGVIVSPWQDGRPASLPGVVIAAFSCALPEGWSAAMTEAACPPVWLQLEYLSAEGWVDAHHGLSSPEPSSGLPRRMIFPGFTARTGGLLREPALLARRDALQAPEARRAWCIAHDVNPDARLVSLFAYAEVALGTLLPTLAADARPSELLVTDAAHHATLTTLLGRRLAPGAVLVCGALTVRALPFLSIDDYDALLWCCDLNLVRGEDSLTRALWAGRPMLWQAYRQPDDAHHDKVLAFIDAYRRLAGDELPGASNGWVAQMRHYNGVPRGCDDWPSLLSTLAALSLRARAVADALAHGPELSATLVQCVREQLESRAFQTTQMPQDAQ